MYLNFVLETGTSRIEKEERRVTMNRLADILVIVDSFAGNFVMAQTSVFMLNRKEGLQSVAQLLESGRLDIRLYKFVVLLCGKADLMETDEVFKEGLHRVLRVIKQINSKAIVVLTAVLLVPSDSRAVIKISGYRAGYMSRLAELEVKLEFSCPGKRLLKLGGGGSYTRIL